MHASEAERTLSDVDRLKRTTRSDLHALGYANVVIGVFFVVTTTVGLLASSEALSITVFVTGIVVALVLIGRHQAARERELGVESRIDDASLRVFLGILIVIPILNTLIDGDFGKVAWAYAVAAGWVAIAALYREPLLGAAAAGLVALATVLFAADAEYAGAWTQIGMGAMLIVVGLLKRA